MILTGCLLMLTGLVTLFALVVKVISTGLFLVLAAYSALIVGMLLSAAGISARYLR